MLTDEKFLDDPRRAVQLGLGFYSPLWPTFIAAAGAGDGRLQLGGVGVDVLNGVARLARNGALAGSTLMLAEAVRRQVGRGHDPDHVVSAATTTPAYALGLATGVLQPEAPADLGE